MTWRRQEEQQVAEKVPARGNLSLLLLLLQDQDIAWYAVRDDVGMAQAQRPVQRHSLSVGREARQEQKGTRWLEQLVLRMNLGKELERLALRRAVKALAQWAGVPGLATWPAFPLREPALTHVQPALLSEEARLQQERMAVPPSGLVLLRGLGKWPAQ